jgi:myxalamid-type polyketide synthase MxaB/epothilone polyketide synthase D
LINLIRKAHEATGVSTADVGYVEAHAVGTQVGDIIELRALNDVFSESPVYVGSVKTNIGHSEAVSGLAGILKALHIMKIKAIAPNLHFDGFNPRARLRSTKLKVAVSPAPWPSSAFASSVSAFGIMGANAHVVLTCDVGRCL